MRQLKLLASHHTWRYLRASPSVAMFGRAQQNLDVRKFLEKRLSPRGMAHLNPNSGGGIIKSPNHPIFHHYPSSSPLFLLLLPLFYSFHSFTISLTPFFLLSSLFYSFTLLFYLFSLLHLSFSTPHHFSHSSNHLSIISPPLFLFLIISLTLQIISHHLIILLFICHHLSHFYSYLSSSFSLSFKSVITKSLLFLYVITKTQFF